MENSIILYLIKSQEPLISNCTTVLNSASHAGTLSVNNAAYFVSPTRLGLTFQNATVLLSARSCLFGLQFHVKSTLN